MARVGPGYSKKNLRNIMTIKTFCIRLGYHFSRGLEFILHAFADEDTLGNRNDLKLSLGRSSWIIWFYTTIYLMVTRQQIETVVPAYYWYLLGLSLLGYVIGKQYILTGFSGVDRSELLTEKIDWTTKDHP